MMAPPDLCRLLGALVQGPLNRGDVAVVLQELEDRLPGLAGADAVISAGLAWFLRDLLAYEDAFDEDFAPSRRCWPRRTATGTCLTG